MPGVKKVSIASGVRYDLAVKSPEYIREIFEQSRSTVLATRGYHIATAMWERIFTKALIPRAAYSIDRLASRVPGVRALASSVLFACRKASA